VVHSDKTNFPFSFNVSTNQKLSEWPLKLLSFQLTLNQRVAGSSPAAPTTHSQRRGEIAALRKEWICNDTITLPREIAKNAREHKFPIGRTAQFVLASQKLENSLIFPARGNLTKPFNGWSNSKVALDKASGVSGWMLHDLRRTERSPHAWQSRVPRRT
jgi:hypothetical protein